jgi:hypothetical protein
MYSGGLREQKKLQLPPISYISESPKLTRTSITPTLNSISTPSKIVEFKSSFEFNDILTTKQYSMEEKLVADSLVRMNQNEDELNISVGRQEVSNIKQILSGSTISDIKKRESMRAIAKRDPLKQKEMEIKQNIVTQNIIKSLTNTKKPSVKTKKPTFSLENVPKFLGKENENEIMTGGYDSCHYRFKEIEQYQATPLRLGLEFLPEELNLSVEGIIDVILASKSPIFVRNGRSDDDLYTARYVRGAGKSREGLCLICKPHTWHKIKVSAYWYHMNLVHGVSTTSGRYYPDPIERRLNENGVEEIKCGKCRSWVVNESLVRSEVVNEKIYWWKHAQKCYN